MISVWLFSSLSTKAFLKYLAEMETVNREGNSLGQEAGTVKHCPKQKSPIMVSFFSNDPEDDEGPEKSGQVVGPKSKRHLFFFLGDIFSQKCPDSFIVVLWRIQGAEDLFVAVD